jgi:hypothetical protein
MDDGRCVTSSVFIQTPEFEWKCIEKTIDDVQDMNNTLN